MSRGNGIVPTSNSIKVLAGTVAAIVIIATPILTIGGFKKTVEAHEEAIPKLWQNTTAARSLADKHEVVIPIIQQDMRDLKADVSEVKRDIKEILRAVKA